MARVRYSEKATNFWEISTVDLSYVITVKSTVEILQNFVAFSEYMNFKKENIPCGLLVAIMKHNQCACKKTYCKCYDKW